jgi:hypothetical protein
MLAIPLVDDRQEKAVIMTQLRKGAESNAAVLVLRNLKQLARQTSTDVEGAVAWLESSYSPAEAMHKLLE